MKRHFARTLAGIALLLLFVGQSLDLYRFGLVDRLDAILYDAKLRLTMPGTVDERIVIVDIDERSLAEEGRWPWGRDRLARLLDQLVDHYGVRAVGFDVVFAEPDESSGITTIDQLVESVAHDFPALRAVWEEQRPLFDHDARFAAALRGRPVILGFYFTHLPGGQSSGVLPPPLFPKGSFTHPPPIPSWRSYGGNLAQLQQAAAGGGHFNPLVDFDGIVRRVALLAEYGGDYFEALALAVVRTTLGYPAVKPIVAAVDRDTGFLEGLALVQEGDRRVIPVDEASAVWVPYRGPQGSFPYVSASDVLHGRLPREKLHDRIVLIGTTAPGLMDLRATPVAATYPGVEIHANLIAGMLDGTLKQTPAYSQAANLLQTLLTGLLMALLLPRLSPLTASVVAALTLTLLIGGNFWLWQNSNLVVPLAGALLLVGLLYAFNMSWGYFVEAKAKRQIVTLFGQYVPPELVAEMARNPAGYDMKGRKAELTVLFSDVRGFTTISEALAPEELTALMNEYLGAMTEVIHRWRGTLDKYIGDAIMAFWGAPVADTEHAAHAVRAALGMVAALEELNPRLKERGWPELHIGIGINTGLMTVGDMGSAIRKAYTVMGDAVNLASRLEGLTKTYGVAIIIGEETAERLAGRFLLRELDAVRVKGKSIPVRIFEPLAAQEETDPVSLARVEAWHEALAAYRAQRWDHAEEQLRALLQDDPHPLYDLYLKRISFLRHNPPGPAWDGVTTFETK